MKLVFSIIVPIYNAEKYINRCIESVICQTYPFWQLILVDDGSPDQVSAKCASYLNDSRILYKRKTNGGVSSARNYGITLATGDYISFLDADDYLDSQCLEKCASYLAQGNLDVLQFGHSILSKEDDLIERVGADFGPTDNVNYIKSNTFQKSVWATVCRRQIITNNSLAFDETIRLAEDQLFVLDLLQHANRVMQISDSLYNYIQWPTSSAHHLNADDTEKSVVQIGLYKCIPELNVYIGTLLIQMTIDYLAQKGSSISNIIYVFTNRQFYVANPYGLRYSVISGLLNINKYITLVILKIYGRLKFQIYSTGRPY